MFKPALHLICRLTGWRIPRYFRINASGILAEGYGNIFLWNSISSLICEVVTGFIPPLTVICVLKNRKPPLWEGVLNLAKFTLKVTLEIFFLFKMADSIWRTVRVPFSVINDVIITSLLWLKIFMCQQTSWYYQ